MVHPARLVLAFGAAGASSAAPHLASMPAIPRGWDSGGSGARLDPCHSFYAGTPVGMETILSVTSGDPFMISRPLTAGQRPALLKSSLAFGNHEVATC